MDEEIHALDEALRQLWSSDQKTYHRVMAAHLDWFTKEGQNYTAPSPTATFDEFQKQHLDLTIGEAFLLWRRGTHT
jgi:hypothetical protein